MSRRSMPTCALTVLPPPPSETPGSPIPSRSPPPSAACSNSVTAPLTRSWAPSTCPTLAAVSFETTFSSPISCSRSTSPSAARSTTMKCPESISAVVSCAARPPPTGGPSRPGPRPSAAPGAPPAASRCTSRPLPPRSPRRAREPSPRSRTSAVRQASRPPPVARGVRPGASGRRLHLDEVELGGDLRHAAGLAVGGRQREPRRAHPEHGVVADLHPVPAVRAERARERAAALLEPEPDRLGVLLRADDLDRGSAGTGERVGAVLEPVALAADLLQEEGTADEVVAVGLGPVAEHQVLVPVQVDQDARPVALGAERDRERGRQRVVPGQVAVEGELVPEVVVLLAADAALLAHDREPAALEDP